MSRLTGNEAKGLMEAYNAVYAPQQEEVVEEVLDEQGGTRGAAAAQARQAAQNQKNAQAAKTALQSGKTLGVAGNFGLQTGTKVSLDSAATQQQGRTVVRATDSPNISNPQNKIRLAGQDLYRAKLAGKDVYVSAKKPGSPAPPVDGSASPSSSTAPPKDVVVQAAKGGVPGTLNKTTGKWTANANSTATAGSTPTTKTTPAPTSTTPTPAARPSLRSDIEDLKRMQAASMMRQQGRNMPDGSIPTGDSLKPKPAPVPAATAPAPKPAPVKKNQVDTSGKPRGEDLFAGVDLFDIVKGHLMSEGYADNEEAALAIMANMSEEWRQSILLELTPLGVKTAGVVDDQRRGSTMFKDLKGTRDALDKMKAYPNGFPGVKGV